MNYKSILDSMADTVESIIVNSNAKSIPTEDFGWVNKRYTSELIRLAHIERYSDKNLEVLHITCFPNEQYQNPIFGFDIICTEKKVLAAFMDWSPVDNNSTIQFGHTFETAYPLPEWAKQIFSNNALAIIPNDTELDALVDTFEQSFKIYFDVLTNSKPAEHRVEYIKAAQNRYCENQQKNERTYNVLKAKLGEEQARYFMQNILFPKIN